MKKLKRIGVFVCHCGLNIARAVDVEKVVEEVKNIPEVVHAEDYVYMCSDPGQDLIKKVIQDEQLDGVVVANCSPTLHERTFRNVSDSAGLNPYRCEIANVREQCSWPHEHDRENATNKSIKIIKSMIEKLKINQLLEPITVPLTKRALVIGGGITGMQAALDIADGGYEVYLVERTSSIGGRMAQLSETFPTLDCPQCIMTPKMTEVNQHPNIHLHTYSEVEDISGYIGNFKVKINQKSPYIDWSKCTGCSDCVEPCPVDLPNEFEMKLSTRKAAYRPFPQAVPNKFVIDKRGVPPCRAACPIHVNAQGYVALISKGKYQEAIELVRNKNPFPGITGRICTHPCETACKRGEVDKPIAICGLKRTVADLDLDYIKSLDVKSMIPKERKEKVAIIGSGPAGMMAAYDLRLKGFKVTIFEALPVAGGMLAVGIPEYRLPREILKHEISLLEKLGVELKLNTPIGKKLTISALQKKGYGAIFIAVGTHISSKLRIEGEDLKGVVGAVELLRQVNLGKKVKLGAKVAVIGGGNAAIDAARTALRLGVKEVTIVYRRSRQEMPANPEEIEEAEHEGVKIHYLANPKRIIGNKGKVTQMECIKMELGAPDESGRRRPIPIEGSEFKIDVDNVIPAIGQSPDLEWLGYANPKTAEFNLTPWGTFEADEITAETNLNGIFAGGDAVTGPRSFIEALAAGRKAAISIAKYLKGEKDLTADRADIDEELAFHELGEPVVDTKNVETEPRIEPLTMPVKARAKAGNFKEVNLGLKPEQAAQEASRCLSCGGCSECMECVKVCKPEAIFHDMVDQTLEAEVGAVVIATGFDLYDKKEVGEYGYGSIPDVIDGLQFERLLSATGPTGGKVQRPSDGKVPKEVVFVQCVGSRDPELGVPYCSRICCMYTAKQALLYKHAVPDGQAYVFYIDIRSAGKGYEEFVQRAQEEEGILYLRGKVAKIFQEPGKEGEDSKVIVWGADTLTSKKVEVAADLVVLATAVVPSEGIKELASKLRVSTDEFGFVKEAHLKLRPAETLTAGIYLAGVAQSPKDITDSVAQGSATAAKILALFSNDELLQDPTISWVDEEVCAGCGNCVNICAYSAVELDDKKNIAKINDALCEGCGACAAVCPSGAMQHKNYSKRQVMDMIDVVTEEYGGI